MKLARNELKNLMKKKLMQAGLQEAHAETAAEILTWSSERGYHSHGEVRVEYYCERIAKGGMTIHPHFEWKVTGPCSAIFEGDNGCGYVAAKDAMEKAIDMASENGIAVVGIRNISHSGSIGYYTEMAAKKCLQFRFVNPTRWLSRTAAQNHTTEPTQSPSPRRLLMSASLSSTWPLPCRPGARF